MRRGGKAPADRASYVQLVTTHAEAVRVKRQTVETEAREWWTEIERLIAKKEWAYELRREAERCARHSGFRECCVRFYVEKWKSSRWFSPARLDYIERYFRYSREWERRGRSVDYIPCPTCIGRDLRPVEMLGCDCLEKLKKRARAEQVRRYG